MRKNICASVVRMNARIPFSNSDSVHSLKMVSGKSAVLHRLGETHDSQSPGTSSSSWKSRDRSMPIQDFCSVVPGFQKKCAALKTALDSAQGHRWS